MKTRDLRMEEEAVILSGNPGEDEEAEDEINALRLTKSMRIPTSN